MAPQQKTNEQRVEDARNAYDMMVRQSLANSEARIRALEAEKEAERRKHENERAKIEQDARANEWQLINEYNNLIQQKDDAIAAERREQTKRMDGMRAGYDLIVKDLRGEVQDLHNKRVEDEQRHGEEKSHLQRLHLNDVQVLGDKILDKERELTYMLLRHITSNFENTTAMGHNICVAFNAGEYAREVNTRMNSINKCLSKIRVQMLKLENLNVKIAKGFFSRPSATEITEVFSYIDKKTTKMNAIITEAISAIKNPVFEKAIFEEAKKVLNLIQSTTTDFNYEMAKIKSDMMEKHRASLESMATMLKTLDQAIIDFPRLINQTVVGCITEEMNKAAVTYREQAEIASIEFAAISIDGNKTAAREGTLALEAP